MHNILFVEDSADSFLLVKHALGHTAHLDWAKSVAEACRYLQRKEYDLVLLDLVLPDGDGFRICSMLQSEDRTKRVPVIFVSGKDSVTDKVMGFSVGGDDFVTKPFDPIELKSRIEARLRKRLREKEAADFLRLGDLEINRVTQKVTVFDCGKEEQIDLTPIEFRLLLFLSAKPNYVFSREETLNGVWGQNVYVYPRSVDTHVSKLRKKLGAVSHYVQSVHGTGYRFVVDKFEQFGGGSARAAVAGQTRLSLLSFGVQH